MGYSVVSTLSGHEYRYTEWVYHRDGSPDFEGGLIATELYNHSLGAE